MDRNITASSSAAAAASATGVIVPSPYPTLRYSPHGLYVNNQNKIREFNVSSMTLSSHRSKVKAEDEMDHVHTMIINLVNDRDTELLRVPPYNEPIPLTVRIEFQTIAVQKAMDYLDTKQENPKLRPFNGWCKELVQFIAEFIPADVPVYNHFKNEFY